MRLRGVGPSVLRVCAVVRRAGLDAMRMRRGGVRSPGLPDIGMAWMRHDGPVR